MGFLRWIGNKVNQARAIGSKVVNGVAAVGGKVADIANRVGGAITAVNPELGGAIQAGSQVVRNITNVAKNIQSGNSIGDVADSARQVRDSVNALPPASTVVSAAKDAARTAFA